MKIMIINGPSLNMLGIRETDIYGFTTYKSLVDDLKKYAEEKNFYLSIKQSNHEGEIIDFIQSCYFEKYDGIIINPGAYTHTSIAILDALKSVNIPVIEVHISDINNRENFRKISYVSLIARKTITNQGVKGYFLAIDEFLRGKTC